jgi:outer membrane protein OmpA-like peptidoglycan-associated protein/tetratricopeptide (TPR) repeat protein
MKKLYILFLIIAVSSTIATAQNKDTKKADALYNRLAYTDAVDAYKKVLDKGKGDRYVFEQLAHCYYNINDSKNAETYYKRVVKGRNVEPETIYNYAQSLKANGRYGEFNTWMKKFAQLQPNDSRAIAFMKDPDYLPRYMESDKKFDVENLSEINTEYSEFGGTLINKSFYFSSARNTKRKNYGWNDEPYLDIYIAENVGGTIKNVAILPGKVNTKYHEGNVTITADASRMYFDRNDYFKGKYKKSEEGINQINLYTAESVSGEWGNATPVNFNNSEYSFGQPALSPDGKTLYFVSDMPGGKGMSDIYKVAINKDGSFGKPERLGDNINTEGKEVFPFVDANGILYFSSDGHLGYGELDVFFAEAEGSGFGTARNIGTDVNSPKDDFAFKFDVTTQQGFVSSNRERGVGSDDIYGVKQIAPLCDVEITVQVLNEYTNAPLAGARVDFFDDNENKLATKTTDSKGNVTFLAECEKQQQILAFLQDYESNGVTVTTKKYEDLNTSISLKPIESIIDAIKVVLNPILFDFDKHNIKSQAAFELDKLVSLMEKYPTMEIKVESYTDNRGSKDYNMDLSNRRAQSTVQYIISKGINKTRVSGQGFGKSKPIEDCGNNCTNEQYQKNRRSEFTIVKQ